MFQVYNSNCKNCLLSPNRIVSPAGTKEIISNCERDQSYFICHKSSSGDDPNGTEICCHTFYKKLGHTSQMVRTSERMGWMLFVDQPVGEKLPTHTEMTKDYGKDINTSSN